MPPLPLEWDDLAPCSVYGPQTTFLRSALAKLSAGRTSERNGAEGFCCAVMLKDLGISSKLPPKGGNCRLTSSRVFDLVTH